jgi:hypothetical protein
MTVSTAGEHSAPIRSNRGGGTMRVDGGAYNSTGDGSPAIYSTADIAVHNATLNASGSEAASIEGKNSIRLFDCDLTGNMSDSEQNDNTWGVILYQSMSGDSTVGTSEFAMVGGKLNIKNGGYFHTNSTSSEFLLDNVTLSHENNDSYEYLIRCCGNKRWNSGAGSTCNFTCVDQTMTGKVIYDSASTLNLYLTGSTAWTGNSKDPNGLSMVIPPLIISIMQAPLLIAIIRQSLSSLMVPQKSVELLTIQLQSLALTPLPLIYQML